MAQLSPTKKRNSLTMGSVGIPKFVKPARIRNISNISFGTAYDGHAPNGGNSNNTVCSNSITYGPQSELPPLPIPTLKETMEKFLKCLEALEIDGDPEEKRETERIVKEFLVDTRSGGKSESDSSITGPILQELLLEYDKTGRETETIGSYVEEFWSDAYLAPDASVVLNLNPYFLLEESPDPKLVGNQIRRAAGLCFASVKMASQLRQETLKPDSFRGKALCMAQFRDLFGSSRVPKSRERDTIASYVNTNHVAVMCCNQLFYFQALWPDTGDVAVDEGDLENILEAIQTHASNPDSKGNENSEEQKYLRSISALGVLTSLPRNQWARARDEMIDYSQKNAESFRVIDSALFVLVLDDFIPQNKKEAAANMLHGSYSLAEYKSEKDSSTTEFQCGSCTNRWYDKLQVIVTADGGAGINFEHSAVDGHTALRFASDIYADTVISFAQSITKLVPAHTGLIPNVISAKVKRAAITLDSQGRATLDVSPKKVSFDVSDSIKRKIYFAETSLGDQILASDTDILEFKDYGKRFITFNRLSPDSFVQMSMILAYYRLYGKIVCAYEPVLTKGFYHGRTEAMRPATMEARKLCEVFCNPSSNAREKLAALRNATIAHSRLVKECAQGKGVDRHLFALKCIAEKNGLQIPEFFRSESWKKLNHTILSTSNCGNPSLALFGFGPVVHDGYGIGYIIKDKQIHYAICSKHRQTSRYALTLESVLREMGRLLEPISNTKVHDNSSTSSSFNTPSSSMNVTSDSYGDLWGENSFKSTIKPGRPKVIHEATAEQRWTGHTAITANSDNFLGQPITAPLNDEVPPDEAGTKERRKSDASRRRERRGSNDLMPVRPDRRSSVNAYKLGKGDLNELMKLDISPGQPKSPQKPNLDEYLKETKNADLISPLKEDEPTPNTIGTIPYHPLEDDDGPSPNMASIPEDMARSSPRRQERRGSNDQMPVRPNRRTSVNQIGIENGDMVELMKLEELQQRKQETIKE